VINGFRASEEEKIDSGKLVAAGSLTGTMWRPLRRYGVYSLALNTATAGFWEHRLVAMLLPPSSQDISCVLFQAIEKKQAKPA
jgi:hypothetical protein